MAVVASAPGKVLLTGGYFILSTNARFYAIVKPLYEQIKPDSWAWGWTDVKLTFPQLSRESLYKLSLKHLMLLCVSSSESRNPFVEQVVEYAVAAAYATFDETKKDVLKKLLLQGLDITILGCNDFYSYRNRFEARGLPLTPKALASLPPFTSINFNAEHSHGEKCKCKPEVAKTGLGSSAAMVTAVVAVLLQYLGVVNLSSSKDQQVDLDSVHVIAQTAHCIAQGKVGSGFGVSSAVYGSQRYVRFSTEVISSALVKGMPSEEVIAGILKTKWDHQKTQFSLPPLMTLENSISTGGSSTPSMVGSVKKCQKSDPQRSIETWSKLSDANSALEAQLKRLSRLAEEQWDAYKCMINTCSMLRADKYFMMHSGDDEMIIYMIYSMESGDPRTNGITSAISSFQIH